MLVLQHFVKQNYSTFISELNTIKNRYLNNVFGIEQELLDVLEQVEAFFKQIGKNSLESKVATLRTYMMTAISGIDPVSLEIVKVQKRKTIKRAVFYCSQELSTILETELDKLNELLYQCEKTLEQIVLTILQNGNGTAEEILALSSIEDIEVFWSRISNQNEQLNFIDKKLRLEILKEDIYLLFSNIITKLK